MTAKKKKEVDDMVDRFSQLPKLGKRAKIDIRIGSLGDLLNVECQSDSAIDDSVTEMIDHMVNIAALSRDEKAMREIVRELGNNMEKLITVTEMFGKPDKEGQMGDDLMDIASKTRRSWINYLRRTLRNKSPEDKEKTLQYLDGMEAGSIKNENS